MTRAEFITRYGGIYEHSPWVAEAAWDIDHTDLAETMAAIVNQSGQAAQLTLLRTHPDLAGKLARAGTLTAASTSEQTSAGLDLCTPAEYTEFIALNDAYKTKFGFPFILAVRGLHRRDILENFRSRIHHDPKTELTEALTQVHKIARLRLDGLTQ